MVNILPKIDFLAQSLFKKEDFCPHCNCKSFTEIARKHITIKIHQCNDCGLCFTNPIYKPSFPVNLYDNFYTAEGSTTQLPSQNELDNLKSNCFQYSDKYFSDRIALIKSIYPGHKLLEIGSSWGYFLYQAQKQGFEVTGVEISEPRRIFGVQNLGVNIVNTLDYLETGTFDIVYTSHVLEHFTDLSTIFKDIYKMLRIGGKLIIEVPNFDFEEFGYQCLSIIGAVHPLGFSSSFFHKNIPAYSFNIVSFYNSWDDFPTRKTNKSSQDVIILVAEKIAPCL